jgi:hypothetical protein
MPKRPDLSTFFAGPGEFADRAPMLVRQFGQWPAYALLVLAMVSRPVVGTLSFLLVVYLAKGFH